MLGDSVELTEGYHTWWSYIPHFIATPGYVYAYAYGQLLALAVYAQYEERGAEFVPKYLELLAAGGSRSPEELGSIVGVDLADPAFWDGGLDIVERQLQLTEAAAKEAGRLYERGRASPEYPPGRDPGGLRFGILFVTVTQRWGGDPSESVDLRDPDTPRRPGPRSDAGAPCRWCGRPLPPASSRGRPRQYCRQSCRQRHYEARHRAAELGLGEDELVLARSELDALRDRLYVLECAIGDVERDLAAGLDPSSCATPWRGCSTRPARSSTPESSVQINLSFAPGLAVRKEPRGSQFISLRCRRARDGSRSPTA